MCGIVGWREMNRIERGDKRMEIMEEISGLFRMEFILSYKWLLFLWSK